eukprot:gnl/TRDRNA2_/TRDRNA2_116188_c1_seq2.p1 gnl/TRDRNA2_/TRDRNA2_116188_c1~~gnl/TRDRNA2_/TRDRNA2_116188_c1_seq2.p1  ORF type:complete len:124 (-),score=9.94 gnl/TRDRNA2_/TRDRNA2_116188_c1_seq2:24-395(-)
MISIHCPRTDGVMLVKPLDLLWQYANLLHWQYGPENTIMIDDNWQNFALNPEQGLQIKAFRDGPGEGRKDEELSKLEDYLLAIKDLKSFSKLDHRNWENYTDCRNQTATGDLPTRLGHMALSD